MIHGVFALTLAGCEAGVRLEAERAGHHVSGAVGHVAGGRRLQEVDDELGAVFEQNWHRVAAAVIVHVHATLTVDDSLVHSWYVTWKQGTKIAENNCF